MNSIQKFSTKSIDGALGYVWDAIKITKCKTVNVFVGKKVNSRQVGCFKHFKNDPEALKYDTEVNVFNNTPLKTENSEFHGNEVLVQVIT